MIKSKKDNCTFHFIFTLKNVAKFPVVVETRYCDETKVNKII